MFLKEKKICYYITHFLFRFSQLSEIALKVRIYVDEKTKKRVGT